MRHQTLLSTAKLNLFFLILPSQKWEAEVQPMDKRKTASTSTEEHWEMKNKSHDVVWSRKHMAPI
jgi:hypothetical protein